MLLTYIAARPGGIPEGYAPIAPVEVLAAQLALLAIYLETPSSARWCGSSPSQGSRPRSAWLLF